MQPLLTKPLRLPCQFSTHMKFAIVHFIFWIFASECDIIIGVPLTWSLYMITGFNVGSVRQHSAAFGKNENLKRGTRTGMDFDDFADILKTDINLNYSRET